MSDFDGYCTYPLDKEEEILTGKLRQNVSATSEIPSYALVSPSRFKSWVASNLSNIQDARMGLKWLVRLKGESTLRHQTKFLEAVETLEKKYISLIDTQTSKVKAQSGLLQAERERILSEWELETVGEDLQIKSLERTLTKTELEARIAEAEERKAQARKPKGTPDSSKDEAKGKSPVDKLKEELGEDSNNRRVREDHAKLEEEKYEVEWRAFCDAKDPSWPYHPTAPALAKLPQYQREEWYRRYQKKEALKTKVRDRILNEE
jgi:hypothetical protein